MRVTPTRRSAIVAVAVTLILLGIAVSAGVLLHGHEQRHVDEQNRERTELAADILRAELDRIETTLRAGGAFLSEQEVATADEFGRFFTVMPLPASVVRVAWAPALAGPELAAFAGTAGLGVGLLTTAGSAAMVATHPWLTVPVLYVAPPPPSPRQFLGVDLSTDPVRRRVLSAAMRTGAARITRPVTLLGEGTPGTAMMAPADGPMDDGRKARGLLIAAIGYADLTRAVLAVAPDLRLSVSDGPTTIMATGAVPDHVAPRSLSAYGRVWTVRAWGTDSPSAGIPFLVAGLGGLAALMVGALILQNGRREEQVAQEVVARTRDLIDERDRSEALIGQAQDGIALVTPGLGIARTNARFRDITGRDCADLGAISAPFPWWSADCRDAAMLNLRRALGGERPAPLEVELRGADGPRTVLLGHAPLMDGRPDQGAVEVITDISSVRRAQLTEAALARIGAAVLEDPPIESVLALIARETRALIGADGAWVLHVDPGSGGDAEIAAVELTAPLAALIPRLARVGGRAAECDDLRAVRASGGAIRVDELAALNSGPHPLHRPGAMAALRRDGALWGCLVVAMPRGVPVPADAEERLGRVAQLTDVALSHARTRAELTSQAFSDPVSGLANDRAFRRTLVAELASARETGSDLSVALLDVDGFDGFSDLLAQTSGEPVLAEIAAALGAIARPRDLIARIGGDEFAWLMPETPIAQALAVAERARIAVAGSSFTGIGHLTISSGVATAGGDADAQSLLARADAALYWAKSEGRNRVEAHDPGRMVDTSAEERAQRLQREASRAALRALAQTVDARDPDTRAHSDRVAVLSERLARALRWSAHDARRLYHAAQVHDIGKIGVPDAVLFKPDRLTRDEFAQVAMHADLGAEIVVGVLDAEQVRWVRHHHERADGAGYPAGLAGDDVPAGARIMAVADSFDVMTNVRTYKSARSQDDALAEVRRRAGSQFDPQVVGALGRLWLAGLVPPVSPGGGSVR
jgi:diguanylate cyclase (GGDEF)-like protein